MGEEIGSECFTPEDRERFRQALDRETDLLLTWLDSHRDTPRGPTTLGFEIEAWLCDAEGRALAENDAFLEAMDSPLVSRELARFNVELNTSVFTAGPGSFTAILQELRDTVKRAGRAAARFDGGVLMAGSLATLPPEALGLHHMSPQARFRALNEAVLENRARRPLHVDIRGREHLQHDHDDVMLESLATSFQIHIGSAPGEAHRSLNAAMVASAPVLAAAGNTPYLFGHDLWEESRIPLFEQAVESGGFADSARGPIRRVTFGSGYLHDSVGELFRENRDHFPVMLPVDLHHPPEDLAHLALHNGTIWRWNRPIVGTDAGGRHHLRVEFRCLPAGPSLIDMLANAAFALGLIEWLRDAPGDGTAGTPFAEARDNFYHAAREGLHARLRWGHADPLPAPRLIRHQLLPRAAEGLENLEIDPGERDALLGIIAARVDSGQTGSAWQRRWVAQHGRDWAGLVRAYRGWQNTGAPVHTWGL